MRLVATRGPAKSIGTAVLASALRLARRRARRSSGCFDDPGPLRSAPGSALAGALIAWVGSWMSMRDESTPGAVPPDVPRRSARA